MGAKWAKRIYKEENKKSLETKRVKTEVNPEEYEHLVKDEDEDT